MKSKEHKINYLTSGIEAKGHTPVYKFHKYFARRPYNLFERLIENYTSEGDLIFDCFCGGGVTIAEGTKLARKVVGYDANPLATFVSESQLLNLDQNTYQDLMNEVEDEFSNLTRDWFQTECRSCSSDAEVRWFVMCYIVKCPHCGQKTEIDNYSKANKNGKVTNGVYNCNSCKKSFKALDAKKLSENVISLRVRCSDCGSHDDFVPNQKDISILENINRNFERIKSKYDLKVPNEDIPSYWDRQQEDCLHRKGIKKFSDFFTKRNLLAAAILKKIILSKKSKLSEIEYKLALFTFSATLRYLSKMNFSTENWMGGRPVAWAKHAYWMPNQFVDVNPIEYLKKRKKAFFSSLKFTNNNFNNLNQAKTFQDLTLPGRRYSHAVFCGDSSSTEIIGDSIDAVITDPPYGSNVQYGELSSYWLVWLKDEIEFSSTPLDLESEVITHRKTKEKGYSKSFQEYENGLKEVFQECFRVLKPERPLVFTFNNRNLSVWFAMMKAVLDAGFYLDKNGVIYQEPIDIYKDTAHARYEGALQGDFVYTFIKMPEFDIKKENIELFSLDEFTINIALSLLSQKDVFSKRELHIRCIEKLIPKLTNFIYSGMTISQASEYFKFREFDDVLKSSGQFYYQDNSWRLLVK